MEENKISITNDYTLFEKGDKGPVLYIRHGKTNYNKFCISAPKEIARVATEYLDCPLNEEGISQAEYISNALQKHKIKKVFCSPLQRCLETCLISLKNHPDKDSFMVKINICTLINPDLTLMFKRNLEFKDLLRKNLEEIKKYTYQINDEKILVFTHSAFTKISTSKNAYNMEVISDFPVDCYKPDNCEIISMNV